MEYIKGRNNDRPIARLLPAHQLFCISIIVVIAKFLSMGDNQTGTFDASTIVKV